jgi:hypothetical protein
MARDAAQRLTRRLLCERLFNPERARRPLATERVIHPPQSHQRPNPVFPRTRVPRLENPGRFCPPVRSRVSTRRERHPPPPPPPPSPAPTRHERFNFTQNLRCQNLRTSRGRRRLHRQLGITPHRRRWRERYRRTHLDERERNARSTWNQNHAIPGAIQRGAADESLSPHQ